MATINHWIKILFRTLRLDAELEDYSLVQESIEKAIVFKGTNLWILIFAIVVASVGLNMNSTAVIIGAMLISPLMGPINGIGFSIATYNTGLLRRSLKNFAFAVVASIVASSVYFLVSPVSNAQSELLARTSPTIFDVIIALFGGFAGIVAISSKNKGNVIPGVAIATALMPPLCTVGYGIASLNLSYFLGALYLFTINTVFIALSSMIVTQILKFPKHDFILPKYKKLTNLTLWLVISVTVLPSVYLGYTLVKKERFQNAAVLYVAEVADYGDNFLMQHTIDADKRRVELVYGGEDMGLKDRQLIKKKAKKFNLNESNIIIIHGLKMKDFKDEFGEINQLKTEFIEFQRVLKNKEHLLDSMNEQSNLGGQLFKEINEIYPEVTGLIYSPTKRFSSDQSDQLALVRIETNRGITNRHENEIRDWLNARLREDSLLVLFDH